MCDGGFARLGSAYGVVMNSIQHWVQIPKIDAIRDTQLSCGEDGPWPEYVYGLEPPNYPMPAVPEIHQWDYSLWCLLNSIPPLTEEEWEREEEEWQDYLDSLD